VIFILIKRNDMERESQPMYTIEPMRAEDVEPATRMRLQSWLDTYTNDEFGVTREWIEERNQEQLRPERIQRGIERLTIPSRACYVARSSDGEIIGSTTPYVDEEGVQHVGSLYVDERFHGKGVGQQLMQKVIEWSDPLKPLELGVVAYNERAKAFYRKWQFEEIPGSETLFDNKIPEIKMIRKGDAQ
jgi:GNAT superfamily N-acetyltransferase